jgi:lipopolysaccharide assembly outer membrane protein LptD (OstA)
MTHWFHSAILAIACVFACGVSPLAAQDARPGQVELNGDMVEYSADGNTIIARGNVVVTYEGIVLTCDRVEFERDTKVAYAQGNVKLVSNDSEIFGREMSFNFDTMEGDLNGAKLVSVPFYGTGNKAKRVNDDLIVVEGGFISTSDFDKPEYRLQSERIEI